MPSAGSVSADVGTSLPLIAAVVLLLAALVTLVVLLLRWATSEPRQPAPELVEEPPAPVEPPRPPAQRRPAAWHHPAGRRVPGAPVSQPIAVRPRRPLERVAADVRRLTRELSMVPGGMPMARRRGLLAAYDDVLIEAAELLDVPNQLATEPPGTRELERMRLLAMLEAAGLVVGD
ncbi:hypothetical protein [Modestobacter versicolor]|uniref:hypothetical protein n=1 Tax=Modestobacter versicolor TaxID=429133 RepID=UPI0034DFFA07